MDIDYLAEQINQQRTSAIRLTTNGGQRIDLPPGVQAYVDATDTMLLAWPPADPQRPYRVTRTLMLAAVNVSTAEPVPMGKAG